MPVPTVPGEMADHQPDAAADEAPDEQAGERQYHGGQPG